MRRESKLFERWGIRRFVAAAFVLGSLVTVLGVFPAAAPAGAAEVPPNTSVGQGDRVRCNVGMEEPADNQTYTRHFDFKCYYLGVIPDGPHAGERFDTLGYHVDRFVFVTTTTGNGNVGYTCPDTGGNSTMNVFEGEGEGGMAVWSLQGTCIYNNAFYSNINRPELCFVTLRFAIVGPPEPGYNQQYTINGSSGNYGNPGCSPYTAGDVPGAHATIYPDTDFIDWPPDWYPGGGGESRDPIGSCTDEQLEAFDGPPPDADLVEGEHYTYSVTLAAPEDGRTIDRLEFILNDDDDFSDNVVVENPTVPGTTTFDVVPTSGGLMGPDQEYEAEGGSHHQKVPVVQCEDSEGAGGAWAYGGLYSPGNQWNEESYWNRFADCVNEANIRWSPDSWLPGLLQGILCTLEWGFVPLHMDEGLDSLREAYDDSGLSDYVQPVESVIDGFGGAVSSYSPGNCGGFEVQLPPSLGGSSFKPLSTCSSPGMQNLASKSHLFLRVTIYVGAALLCWRMLASAAGLGGGGSTWTGEQLELFKVKG